MTLISRQRLHNLQIASSKFQNPVALLSYCGAIQGQDYHGAKWSLGLRIPGSTESQIEQAIADKQVVRAWLMRGTLFLLAARDLRWMLDLIAPRVIKQFQRRYRELDLDEKTLLKSNEILLNALKDGQQLSRRQLYAILEENNISTEGQRGFYITQRASLDAHIIHTTVAGNDPNFLSFEDTIPQGNLLSRDAALAELARRYFSSRGPATLRDFAWWTGLLIADVRAGFEAIQAELTEITHDGQSYWYVTRSIAEETVKSVYMLPGFDEYILGYQNRDEVLNPEYTQKICPGKNGVFFPTIVINGQIQGIWKRTFKSKHVVIDVTAFTAFTTKEKEAISSESERFGAYLEIPVNINFI